MGDSYIHRNQERLRWEYTTGTCAAAASLVVVVMLLQGKRMEQVSLVMPKGICLDLEVEEMDPGENSVPYGIKRDAGDGSDVTDRLMVYSQIRLPDADSDDAGCVGGNYVYKKDGLRLYLSGGAGVGRVTQCGLSCEVRKAIINSVPRKIVFEQAAGVCRESGFKGVLSVEVRVPGASEVAHRTFNNRLGTRGDISVLGTSGIVEPMSGTALLDTIRLELRQRIRKGRKNLLVISRNYGESFVSNILGLGPERVVKYSSLMSSTIDMVVREGAKSTLLIDHGDKLIKLVADTMNIHSFWADGRMKILTAHGTACGAKRELVEQTLEAVTVDEELHLLKIEDGLREQVMKRMMGRLEQHVRRRVGEGLRAEAIAFTNEHEMLGATTGADDLLMCFTDRMRNR